MGAIMNGIAAARPDPRLRRHVPHVLRLHARLGAARGADAGCRSPTSGPTTRSASARTARPTSRSSTSPRCARIPGPRRRPPRRRQRDGRRWQHVLEHTDRPAGAGLTRQNVPVFPRGERRLRRRPATCTAGGYVLLDAEGGAPDVVLIGTGSEVQLAVEAREQLAADGIQARVVSMPCVEWFEDQDQSYRDTVIPPTVKARVSVEAGVKQGWREFVGDHGRIVSIEPLRRLGRLRPDLPGVRRHGRGVVTPPRQHRGRRRPPRPTTASKEQRHELTV